ncbi:hypothetical protein AAF712_004913, partial [Marasmius tenuissimus]
GTPNKTFTSLDDISRGSVLQFGIDHRTVNGDEGFALHVRTNGHESRKVTMASTVTRLKSAPSSSATDDTENQAGQDMRDYGC